MSKNLDSPFIIKCNNCDQCFKSDQIASINPCGCGSIVILRDEYIKVIANSVDDFKVIKNFNIYSETSRCIRDVYGIDNSGSVFHDRVLYDKTFCVEEMVF